MTDTIELGDGRRDPAIVDDASRDSFPASDAPAYTPTTALGAPPEGPPLDMEELPPPLVEVNEHALSDPARRQEAPDEDEAMASHCCACPGQPVRFR